VKVKFIIVRDTLGQKKNIDLLTSKSAILAQKGQKNKNPTNYC
jgi:hypothetical protein